MTFRRPAALFLLLAVLLAAPSAQASIFDDIGGVIDDLIGGIEDIIDPVLDPICDINPFLPACLVEPILPPICIFPPCDEIEPLPEPGPFYRYYASPYGGEKTKVKHVGYDEGEYAWFVDYDGDGFEATDSDGVHYTGTAFPLGSGGTKYQLSLDDDSLARFAERLSERASDAYGEPVTVVLTQLPVVKIKHLEGGQAKLKIKAKAETASADGLYRTAYKAKLLGEYVDHFLPVPLEEAASE